MKNAALKLFFLNSPYRANVYNKLLQAGTTTNLIFVPMLTITIGSGVTQQPIIRLRLS